MGAAFNEVRESILESSMKVEGKFLLDEITKQDGELSRLRAEYAALNDAYENACQSLARSGARAEFAEAEVGRLAAKLNGSQHDSAQLKSEVQRLSGQVEEHKRDRRVLDLIDHVCGDDFCEDLDMRSGDFIGDLKTAHEKLALIYRAAHSARLTSLCYARHDDWRAEVDGQIAAMGAPGEAQSKCATCNGTGRVMKKYGAEYDCAMESSVVCPDCAPGEAGSEREGKERE